MKDDFMAEKMITDRYRKFMQTCRDTYSEHSVEMIGTALNQAAQALDGRLRYDGTPLMDHSVKTAQIVVSEIGLGRNSVISTLFHDVVRLGLMTAESVGEAYGESCTTIIKGLCNISDIHPKISDNQADNIRELIISYSTDPRVILIKLADRLEVMRCLDIFPESKRSKKSWESLNLYAQIAHKLGLYTLKSELEDLSLKYLEPEDYKYIVDKLNAGAPEREKFIARFLLPIEEKLRTSGLKYHIRSRTKSVYSIWNKMKKGRISFDEVYDIFALRIILDCPKEQEKPACWTVYSIVTDFYTPNPERLRDWISIPKSNGYESLHTTVVTPDGHWVEVQIRTERMDEVAERGIAAHWRYKGVNQGGLGSEEWLAKLRYLIETTDTHQISKTFDSQLTSKEIFVFTPTGDLRRLPEGATVLDFAFNIHTNVGAACIGGRVNKRNVPIKHVLKNGDIVEIITSKTQKPKSDWLSVATTARAKNKIKALLREEAAKMANLGREELERKIKNWKIAMPIDDAVTVLCKYYKLRTGTDVYERISRQKIELSDVKDILQRYLSGEQPEEPKKAAARRVTAIKSKSGDALVIDDRIGSIEYKFAKCCNPIFGDDVFGFVTVNSGITIHRSDCPNAARMKELYPYRVMPARWRDSASQGAFQVSIRVVADDTTGMLNHITDLVNQELKLNIRSVNMSSRGGTVEGVINIEVPNSGVVDTVIYKILRIKGVQKAYRVNK